MVQGTHPGGEVKATHLFTHAHVAAIIWPVKAKYARMDIIVAASIWAGVAMALASCKPTRGRQCVPNSGMAAGHGGYDVPMSGSASVDLLSLARAAVALM